MDIAWAHILQTKLNNQNNKKDKVKNIKKDQIIIKNNNNNNNCTKCGQQSYFCQCKNINDIILKNFNFEKNNY
jgi:hypothetical protein